jgi:hypothetical protein
VVSPISSGALRPAAEWPFAKMPLAGVLAPGLSLQVDDRAVHLVQLIPQMEKQELDLNFIVHFPPVRGLMSRTQTKNKKKGMTILCSGQAKE